MNLKNVRNIFIITIFIIFTFINLGFPKINDEQLDSKLTTSIENTVLCEFNKTYMEPTLASGDKLLCRDTKISGSVATNFVKIPYISSFLLLISTLLILLKLKDEK